MTEDTRAAYAPDAAGRLRGFGSEGLIAIVVIIAGNLIGPPVSALLMLGLARLSRNPMRAPGFTRPAELAADRGGGRRARGHFQARDGRSW